MPGPLMIAPIGATSGRIRYNPNDVASSSIQTAQLKITKLQRWRRNPRHAELRWAHLIPEEQAEPEGESSDRSESVTPVLDPRHSDLTMGQTGQTNRQPAPVESVPTTPTSQSEQLHEKHSNETEPSQTEETLAEEGCGYYCSWTFKDKVTEFFEEPMSSRAAYISSVVVMIAILLSITAILLESLPELEHYDCCKDTASLVFDINEGLCISVFTVEYVTRIWAARDKAAFVRQPMNVVDLVAILPFYLTLMASSLGSVGILRLFRLVRVFRVFKLSKHNKAINVCFSALYESRAIFGLMLFLLTILTVVFGSFQYNFEEGGKDPWGRPTPFVSIPAAMWWCIVTVMMVGYGDMVPTSIPGKLCASACIVVGIMVMALPISVIGTNFSQAWDAQKQEDADVARANELPQSTREKLKKVITKVKQHIIAYNRGSLDQINCCHEVHANAMNQRVADVWKSYKARIQKLSSSKHDHSHQAQLRTHYVSMLESEKSLNKSVGFLGQVCNREISMQFERADLNVRWTKLCLSKFQQLHDDVKSMELLLKHSACYKVNQV